MVSRISSIDSEIFGIRRSLKGTVDRAIFRQALHHALQPERMRAATHRMLKNNGRVVILDLLAQRFEKSARTLRGSLAWIQ